MRSAIKVKSKDYIRDSQIRSGFLLSSSQDETINIWNLKDRTHHKALRCRLSYEKSIINNTTGLTEAQKMTWQALGAIV